MTEENTMQALKKENEYLRIRLEKAEAWSTKLTVALFLAIVLLPIVFMQ